MERKTDMTSIIRSFGSNNNQQDQMDDKTSAFGSANEKSDWPQQFAGRGAWEGPQTASWTGAPSAIPFNQVSDYGQQQPQGKLFPPSVNGQC